MLSEKPWKPERVMLLFLGIFIGVSFFLLLGAIAQHTGGKEKPDANSPGMIVLSTLAIQGSMLFGTGLTLWWYQINWRQAFGFAAPRKLRAAFLGLFAALLFLPVGFFLRFLSFELLILFKRKLPEQEAVAILQNASSWEIRVYLIAFSILIAPLAEEILFRGILYPAIRQMGFPRLALWLSSILFATIHFNLPTFLPLLVLGLALVWLYEKTDNLLAPIAAHAAFNAFNVLLLYFGEDLSEMLNRLFHHH